MKKEKQQNKMKELIKNTLIIFMGKASTQFISFLLLPLYTAYIVTSEYGYVDLIITYVSLIVLIMTLELDLAAFRFLIDYREDEDGKEKVISNVFFCLLISIIVFIVAYSIINVFINFKYSIYILLIVLTNMFSSVLIQIARGLGKNLDYSISCIIGGIVTILLNVILIVQFHLGGKGLLISLIVSNLSISLYLLFKLKILKMIKPKYKDKKMIKELIKYSIPLIPNQISWWIVNVSDRTIVSFVLGTTMNGIYSIANKFPNILNSIYNIFHLSWSEQASLHFEDNDRNAYFSSIVNNGIKIFGSICLLIIVVIPIIFNVLINQSYAEAYYQIPILLTGILFSITMSLFGVVYVAKKMSKELAKTSTMTAAINIIVNVLLIKLIGLYSASISTLVAYLFVMIYRWIDVKKYITIDLDKKNIAILILCFIITITCYYINIFYLNIIVCILTVSLILYINKNNIFNILTVIKNIKNKF